ncbi:uncharacterized protein LOC127777090 [Oryza glaberrima]|uniref:Uncharacterized protein n=1 Tax=Oryza glaberrima TaxID=4538 RepID=I1Q4V9_ORYGL|nr:uncharacterized protein LOC127777090 [Oryza glaberrima]
MRRRRWPARCAAALCIAVVVLQLAAAAAARSLSSSRRRAHDHGHRVALPASAAAAASSLQQPVHRAVAKAKGGGRSTAFDAGGGVPCKEKSGGHGGAPSPCSDDDDKRVVPTGPNPLHNRNKNCPHQLFLHGVFVSIPQVEDSAVHHV